MPSEGRVRLRIIAVLAFLVGGIFVLRLYYVQVIHSDAYHKSAERQYVASVPNLYDRGSIYFSSKDGDLVAAATIASGYLLAVIPPDIVSPEETATALANALPRLSRDEVRAVLMKKDDPYEEIATRLSDDDASAIRKLDLPGVRLYRQTWRTYPAGTLAAQTVGFVGYEGDAYKGRYGLERYYEDTLERKSENVQVNFFAELFSNMQSAVFDRTEYDAGDVVLTIEPTVQGALEEELAKVMAEWHSDSSGGVIMDPMTGAVYAMASVPTFNVNDYKDMKDPSVFRNPIVEDQYEMGSIVKPLTVAAGLDAGVITPASTYNDTGTITLNNKTISNYDGRARGPGTTMQQVLNQSLNLGVANIVTRLGNARFADYMLQKYRLGEETGVDLPGEVAGNVHNLSSTRDVEYATASFGQGIALSPIAMTAALSTLGNGGMTVTPYVVREIRYKRGGTKVVTPLPGTRAISQGASDTITQMLVTVVDKALLDGSVRIPEYTVAAKTGTAQMARPRALGGGYYEDRYLHTFFGYFPAYHPRFIIFLYTMYPKNVNYASHTLTYPFMRLTKFLLNYYNIPPDRGDAAKTTLRP